MAYVIVVLAVLARFIPHLDNFSPVYGALLFGGAYIAKRHSLWFPLAVLAASDLTLTHFVYHMHSGWGEFIQLAAFASILLVGWSLRGRFSAGRFVTAVLAGPTAFYLISNLGVWLSFQMYPASLTGLVECYVAGLPFYGRTLLSGVIFSVVFFGAHEYYQRRFVAGPQYAAAANQ